MKPTVLIATTARWFPTARLAVAVANSGFTVDAVCPSHHPLSETDALRRIYGYRGLDALASFGDAISASRPDLIVPGDDLATQHLHLLYDEARRKGDSGIMVCALIERSLGAAEGFAVIDSRTKFMELAQSEGIRVPRTDVIRDSSELKKWFSHTDFPAVLKSDGSSGGDGVRVVAHFRERRAGPAIIAGSSVASSCREANSVRSGPSTARTCIASPPLGRECAGFRSRARSKLRRRLLERRSLWRHSILK